MTLLIFLHSMASVFLTPTPTCQVLYPSIKTQHLTGFIELDKDQLFCRVTFSNISRFHWFPLVSNSKTISSLFYKNYQYYQLSIYESLAGIIVLFNLCISTLPK